MVLKALRVHRAPLGLRVRKVLRALKVSVAFPVQLGRQARRVWRGQPVLKERLALSDLKVPRASEGIKESKAFRVRKESRALLALKVSGGFPDPSGHRAPKENRGHKALKANEERPGRKAFRAFPARKGNKALLALKVSEELPAP
ncbi:MAG TPA: hypothetical protein VEH27_18590 [Methylomirabilota bacterium]|nr:hypothetical protein [Methylomirabilota bacterium]